MTTTTDTAGEELAEIIDVGSERAVLGSLIHRPDLASEVFTALTPDDFAGPGHALLAATLQAMTDAGEPIDPRLLLSRIIADGTHDRVGGGAYLVTLMQAAIVPSNALRYARDVITAARRRRLVAAATRALQRARVPHLDVTETALELSLDVEPLLDPPIGRTLAPPLPVEDFLLGNDAVSWLVPGLLERMDRLIVTASEGAGKSTLLRQMAVCAACGTHPFTLTPHEPLRVLVVDCENSAGLLRRRFRVLVEKAERLGRPVPAGQLRILSRPDGLDLARADDAGWLAERVAAADPQLLVVGPLYRLHTGALYDEEPARALVSCLDRIRARHGCAVVMETHSPHQETVRAARSLRPFGSSLFMRWPEFGYGLRPVKNTNGHEVDVIPWRGPRDERGWPSRLRRGRDQEWPWVETLDDWGAP